MEKQGGSPTARFTAVNGKESSISGAATSAVPADALARRASEDRPNGQPRISPPGQERLTITTTTTTREDWPATNGARPSNMPTAPHNQTSASYSAGSSAHKRKRSGSMDRQDPSTASYHSHGLPTPQTSGDTTTAPEIPEVVRDVGPKESVAPDARDPYPPKSSFVNHVSTENREPNVRENAWYSQQSSEAQNASEKQLPPMSSHASDEQRHRDAIERNNSNIDSQANYTTSPGEENDDNSPYPGQYGQDRNSLPVQGDPKKRKRNFSNRTKTGCMTCRKRKKKCDETRPECNNCIRGGFVCNGYPQRGQWQKSEQKQPPVPLQSKDGYETSSSPYSQTTGYQGSVMGQQKREPLPGYRGQQLRVDPQQGPARPLSMDDDRPSASTILSASISSPENRLSAISYQHAFPTPTSATPTFAERHPSDYKRVPPLHDMTRQEHELGTPQSAQSTTSLPHINILHPNHSTSPHSHPTQSSSSSSSNSVQDTARLALSHPVTTGRPRTQKEEMLAGKQYFPFDKELVLERERCNGACWRFNSSTNPNNGVSPEERARLFRDILQPRDHVQISPTMASPVTPVGRVGDNVVVEAPFNCDYGYNISIGQDVAIGKNCTILDTCEVRIGDRCIIGPNVNIYTATLPVDPKRRLGSRGPSLGKPIIIEEDCWIGGGVTILPGRTIRKGSTVGAGSIVTKDVPKFTVVGGNPARVLRGLYRGHES